MKEISAVVFVGATGAPVGSDIHSIRKRLELKVLDGMEKDSSGRFNATFGDFEPDMKAMHIFCYAMSNPNWCLVGQYGNSSMPNFVNDAVELFAYTTWEKRQQFRIGGNAQSDWEHGLDMFADYCFMEYNSSREKNKAA